MKSFSDVSSNLPRPSIPDELVLQFSRTEYRGKGDRDRQERRKDWWSVGTGPETVAGLAAGRLFTLDNTAYY